jgi:hypothetical protein
MNNNAPENANAGTTPPDTDAGAAEGVARG